MTFTQAIQTCFLKYVDFTGRASRSEYWWFYLFNMIVVYGLALFGDVGAVVSLFANLVFFLPSLTVAVRRLHDVGRSGWWLLLGLTIIGIIPILYWLIKSSDVETNEYGTTSLT